MRIKQCRSAEPPNGRADKPLSITNKSSSYPARYDLRNGWAESASGQTETDRIGDVLRDSPHPLAGEQDLDVLMEQIGVVDHPERGRGNYVPTSLPQRYDDFIFLNRTDALHPLPVAETLHGKTKDAPRNEYSMINDA